MTSLTVWLQQRLAEVRASSRWRRRKTVQSRSAGSVSEASGRTLINFASNDYLGLATHARVQQALIEGAGIWGVGSGASHLICGHTRAHDQLDEMLAAFTGREAALSFSTGYMANLGLVQSLVGRGDAVFEDRLNHASLIDAGLASGARFQRYAHNDVEALKSLLEKSESREKLVVTDGVFSMDGDVAPLRELAGLCRAHEAWLMVDDAHGFGVLGERGGGVLDAQQLSADDVPLLMATLGKAVGSFGAFVAGSRDLIDHLLQNARTYRYTTALPPALAMATSAAVQVMQDEPWRRAHLRELITQFRREAADAGLPLMPSATPIQPLLIGDDQQALRISAELETRGYWITAIRPPTVPDGTARLRITLTAAHDAAQVSALVRALSAALEKNPLPA